MPSRLRIVLVALGLVLSSSFFQEATDAQTVWSGLTYSFSKPDGVDGTLLEYQDEITPNAVFARGFTFGLYNAATEPGWNGSGPEFTQWATSLVPGNEELGENQIVATNYANLQFTDWLTAFGGGGGTLHLNLQDLNAVVYLELDDIYLDINFDYWGAGRLGGDGGFSYMRAQPPAPQTNGDYSGNLVVDAADYTVWRDTLGQFVDLGTGADGHADGFIDELDYDFWKERFGNVILMGSGGISAAVPEPASCLLLVCGWPIIASVRKRSPRGPGQSF